MFKFRNAFVLLLLTTLFSCNRAAEQFTTEKWLTGDGLQYPLRDDVVDDLVQNHKLKGLTYKEVHHLLGYPNWSDSTKHEFYYQIVETHNNMHKPAHVKNLVFYLSKDSVVTRYQVYDHNFKYKN